MLVFFYFYNCEIHHRTESYPYVLSVLRKDEEKFMNSPTTKSVYLLLIVIFMLSLATSVYANRSGYNIQFKQIDENIAFKGKRTEIVVFSTNRRNYNQIGTDKIYAWFDVIADENLVGFPRKKENKFLVNNRVPAAVWSGEDNEPVGIQFSYTNPRQGRDNIISPITLCNNALQQRGQGSARDFFIREGKEIKLRNAYHFKITVKRLVANVPGLGFTPRRLNIITGSNLDVVIKCSPIDPTRRTSGSGKTTQQVSSAFADKIKKVSFKAEPDLEFSGLGDYCYISDLIRLRGEIETTGPFRGSTSFVSEGHTTQEQKFQTSRAGKYTIRPSAVFIIWNRNPADSRSIDRNLADANGFIRKAQRVGFFVRDQNGVIIKRNYQSVNVSCRI